MAQNSARNPGRHFLQIPGPTPLPDRVLRAMDTPIIDHRGPEFAKVTKKALEGIKTIFKTTNPVVIYTATGTGAWEGALVNTLPPGMSFNAIGDKALKASQTSAMPKSFFAWDDMLNMNKIGFFPYTPATQMLHGLLAGIEMLHEEGLDNVFARHQRLAEATRRAVKAWGLENLNKNASQHSPTITAILLPEGHDADKFRALALDTFNISYGASFGPYAGKYFRIGHLGDITDGTRIGPLGITEMALDLAALRHK